MKADPSDERLAGSLIKSGSGAGSAAATSNASGAAARAGAFRALSPAAKTRRAETMNSLPMLLSNFNPSAPFWFSILTYYPPLFIRSS